MHVRTSSSLAYALFIGACANPAPPVITVGAVSYTEAQLLGLGADRRQSLAELTAFGLAVADSTTHQLGQPLLSEWMEDLLIDILAAELTLEKHDVEDAVLEAWYLTNPQWELTVRHILFFSERWRPTSHRSEAEAKAARAMEALRNGADFAATAAELSEEPGAEGRQGLLTPGREGSWVPEFWAAALSLEQNELSPVTETQYGYHILRLETRTVIPFPETRPLIVRRVANQIADPLAILQEWAADAASGAAARAVALEEAARRGLTVPVEERTELLRVWEDQVYHWSATLGFHFGLSPSQVADAAMAALSNSAQGAGLARSALSEHATLLAAHYPVSVAASDS